MSKSGIYKILNTIDNKCYIGSAKYIKQRVGSHKSYLRRNIHPNRYLQAAWNKWGEFSFEVQVLEYCSEKDLISREQYWIDEFCCVAPNGFNLRPIADNMLGFKHSEETKAKMKITNKGRKHSDITKAKISMINKGSKRTVEQKLRMSLVRKGIKFTEEHCKKISNALLDYHDNK